jgi:hypothetical protein
MPDDPQIMVVYVTVEAPNQLAISIQAPGPGGDLAKVIRPGESFMGQPVELWAALGSGRHEIAVSR